MTWSVLSSFSPQRLFGDLQNLIVVFSPNSVQTDRATASKKKIRSTIKKVTSEFELIKETKSWKETIAIGEGGSEKTSEEEVNNTIEILENELEEIGDLACKIFAEEQVRLTQSTEFGEDYSIFISTGERYRFRYHANIFDKIKDRKLTIRF